MTNIEKRNLLLIFNSPSESYCPMLNVNCSMFNAKCKNAQCSESEGKAQIVPLLLIPFLLGKVGIIKPILDLLYLAS